MPDDIPLPPIAPTWQPFCDEGEAEAWILRATQCDCLVCNYPEVWYAALAFLLAERAPA